MHISRLMDESTTYCCRWAAGLILVSLVSMSQTVAQELPVDRQLQTPGEVFSNNSGPVTEEIEQLRERLRLADEEIRNLQSQLANPNPSPGPASKGSASASGQASDSSGGDLASKSQNPVSDLVSLPYQSNFDFGTGPFDRTRFIGNFQPVVPLKLNDDWNLINRMIIPTVNAPIGADARSDGLGDSLFQMYFSPRDSGSLIWGVGPNFLLPTASDKTLGRQEWGAGINGVALMSSKEIVTGVLVSQTWSVEGTTQPFLVQPFFNYNLPEGWFLTASGEFNADWAAPEAIRYSLPLGAGVGRVFPILGQPVSLSTRFAPYLISPDGGPDWQFRLSMSILLPK